MNPFAPFFEEIDEVRDSWLDYGEVALAAAAANTALMLPVLLAGDSTHRLMALIVGTQLALLFTACIQTGAALARVRGREQLLRDLMPEPLLLFRAALPFVLLALPLGLMLHGILRPVRPLLELSMAYHDPGRVLAVASLRAAAALALAIPLQLLWLVSLVRIMDARVGPFSAMRTAAGVLRGHPVGSLCFMAVWLSIPAALETVAIIFGSMSMVLGMAPRFVASVLIAPLLYGAAVRWYRDHVPLAADAVFEEYLAEEHVLGGLRAELDAERARMEELYGSLAPPEYPPEAPIPDTPPTDQATLDAHAPPPWRR